jgi:hypothetical protein
MVLVASKGMQKTLVSPSSHCSDEIYYDIS